MGGRGANSGMNGRVNVSPENLARQAFETNNGVDLQAMKSELKFWRDTEKSGGELDEDQFYWVIDKDGTEHFYQPGNGSYADSEIKLNKVAYISNSNADGKYDSNGINTGDDTMRALFEDLDFDNRYSDEISRLYKTSWGRRH